MSCSITERVSENRAATGGGSAGGSRSSSGCRFWGSGNNSRAGPPSTNAAPNDSQNAPARHKSCCLCWCCCYGCVCSPKKGNAEPNNDEEPLPTLDEIVSWGNSFDKLMRNPAGRKVFQNFLQCEYSEENILFWMACEDLKKETNPTLVEEKARSIYEDFVSILSNREVSLDSQVRELVNQNMVHPTKYTFDEAQLQIYTLMHRDSYPRFVNSPIYRSLIEPAGKGDGTKRRTSGVQERDGPGSIG